MAPPGGPGNRAWAEVRSSAVSLEVTLFGKVVPASALAGSGGRPRVPHEDSTGWDASGDVIMDFVILAVVALVVALIVKGVRQKEDE